MKKNWHERKIGNYTFIYHDGITSLTVLERHNGRTYFRYTQYGVEVMQITANGWIILKKNSFMSLFDFEGCQILPYKYKAIFSTCSGVKVKYALNSNWEMA